MHTTLHSFEAKPELHMLKVVDPIRSSLLRKESANDLQDHNIMMLLNEIKSENERLKNFLELQFKLAHAFDIPYHLERKWLQFKTKHVL